MLITGGMGLLFLGGALYPVLRYVGPRPPVDPFGKEGRAPVKGLTPADVAMPGMGGNATYGPRGCLVFRTADGSLKALDAKCTHAGCNVNFAGDKITCHCHGGVYDLDGKNVSGPPPRPLTPLKAFEENGVLYVAPADQPKAS
jgi:Rieske Fe-S protein